MRNPSIELFRYVFAFLVVFIHVPLLHGGMLLMPLARCAVPFFYLISGFFLAKKTCNVDLIPFMPTAKKWILMWGKYFVVFAIIGVLIDWYCGNITYPNIKDFASLVLTGQCMYVDEHIVATHKLGLLTLWFLYEGALAFALIYVLRKKSIFQGYAYCGNGGATCRSHFCPQGNHDLVIALFVFSFFILWYVARLERQNTSYREEENVVNSSLFLVYSWHGRVQMFWRCRFCQFAFFCDDFHVDNIFGSRKDITQICPPHIARDITKINSCHPRYLHLAQTCICVDHVIGYRLLWNGCHYGICYNLVGILCY